MKLFKILADTHPSKFISIAKLMIRVTILELSTLYIHVPLNLYVGWRYTHIHVAVLYQLMIIFMR